MTEFLDPMLFHSIILTQAFQWILIVRRKVLRVCYSFLREKEERSATKFNQDTEEFYNPKITPFTHFYERKKKEAPLNSIKILKNSITQR